jgi:hypothetical protein
MKLGYIQKINLEMNPHLTERFRFKETTFTRRITSKGDRIYSKMFHPLDYEDVVSNTNIMKGNSKIILVGEPFILDEALKEKVVRWVEWANHADPKEYDPFA